MSNLIIIETKNYVETIYAASPTFQVALETLNNKIKAILEIDKNARPVFAPQVVEGDPQDFILMQQWAYSKTTEQ